MAHKATRIHPLTPPSSQSPGATSDPTVIYLDAAHGGNDTGTHLGGDALEKDATLALAIKLRALLAAHGFKVVMTRSTPADAISTDQRIEAANRSHASACLLLHASHGGHGVHLYTSSLTGSLQLAHTRAAGDGTIVPWDTTQAPMLPLSLDLESNLASALNGIRIPLVTGRASISPIDAIICPAVAVELAPYTPDGQAALDPSDSGYQQRVAEAIATALLFRSEHLQNGGGTHTKPPSAAHPAATRPAPATRSKPATGAAATSGSTRAPDITSRPNSHVSPGVRTLPGVSPNAIPAKPTPKPEPQGASL